MSHAMAIDEARLEKDLDYRVAHLKEFVGYTDEDQKMIQATIGRLARHAQAVIDGIYDHLFRFTSTAKYFVSADGKLKGAFLAKRKETLTTWLVRTGKGEVTADFMKYIAEVGVKHTEHAGELDVRVPRHYFVALMSVVQSGITGLLDKECPDREEFRKATIAWNKMLMLILEFMFYGWSAKAPAAAKKPAPAKAKAKARSKK